MRNPHAAYQKKKNTEYDLLLNMHINPLPTLVTQQELAEAELAVKQISSKSPQKASKSMQYADVMRRNAQLTSERTQLTQELDNYKKTISAQQAQIHELKLKQSLVKEQFQTTNFQSENCEFLQLRSELNNKLEELNDQQFERQRKIEMQIRQDFQLQLLELERDCSKLVMEREELLNDPKKLDEVITETEFLKKRCEDLQRDNGKQGQVISVLNNAISENRTILEATTFKLARAQRSLTDYESKIRLYEEMFDLKNQNDFVGFEDEKIDIDEPVVVGGVISKVKRLEAENQRLQKALSEAHKMTISAQQQRLKILSTPMPVKQLLMDILKEINTEITQNTVKQQGKSNKLAASLNQLAFNDLDSKYIQLEFTDIQKQNLQESKFNMQDIEKVNKEKILLKLLEHKNIVEMTVTALDVEQSVLLSGNSDVLNWIRTSVVK
ncbi:hypothetical protein SS50377_26805 [Spironucleus salmonicida]|uniref:Uncharacterized protein n=1 Tax=Spironucleus salmonicida TaxID=348837 RepID=V6LXK0_9EUKA|nr:hypothetical protein SS50377_26805 [Spironucleus salmonicida]|eukprot:EST49275.1 Hypothetical protein SS50377_10496 [Spironucleus salmonicida]